MKKAHTKKRFKIKYCLIILLLAIFFLSKHAYDTNPGLRLLISVITFSERTLKNPEYLAYNIDLMDLFQDYMNADTCYQGNAYIKEVKGFNNSVSASIAGQRSMSKKQMSCESDMTVLVAQLGAINLYAQDQTIYLTAPMLGDDVAYSFDTGCDLFKKAPQLTSDINRQWFRDNASNIYNFISSIEIKRTNTIFTDEDGTEARRFDVHIPTGQGDFIWELLGMDAPDYDIDCCIFLDKYSQTRKIVFDLSHSIDGATLIIYGNHLSTMEMSIPLPDNEKAVINFKRDGSIKYTNCFICTDTYYASNGYTYTCTARMTLDFKEDGLEGELGDILVKKGNTVIGEGSMSGKVTLDTSKKDVFRNASVDLSTIETMDWKELRDDTAGFIEDVLNKSNANLSIFR